MPAETQALRPPEKWAHLRWHWIASLGHPEGEVMQWTSDKCWWSTEDDSDLWPDRMDGYSYLRRCSPDAIVIDAASEDQLKCVAASIANARGGRRGAPAVSNILDVLKTISSGKLYDEVMDDASAVLTALATLGKGDGGVTNPLDLAVLPDDMRHAADEDESLGSHLQATYLRHGAEAIDHLRRRLAELEAALRMCVDALRGLSITIAGEQVHGSDGSSDCAVCAAIYLADRARDAATKVLR